QELDHGLPQIPVISPRLHFGHHPAYELPPDLVEEVLGVRFGRDEALAVPSQVGGNGRQAPPKSAQDLGSLLLELSRATRSAGVKAKWGVGHWRDSTPVRRLRKYARKYARDPRKPGRHGAGRLLDRHQLPARLRRGLHPEPKGHFLAVPSSSAFSSSV